MDGVTSLSESVGLGPAWWLASETGSGMISG